MNNIEREDNIENEISKLKSEAVSILDQLFKIPEGYSNGLNRRLIECIISAAILEITNLNKKEIEDDKQKFQNWFSNDQ